MYGRVALSVAIVKKAQFCFWAVPVSALIAPLSWTPSPCGPFRITQRENRCAHSVRQRGEEPAFSPGFCVWSQSCWASMFYLKEGDWQLAKSLKAAPNLCVAELVAGSPSSSPIQLPHFPGCRPCLKKAGFGGFSLFNGWGGVWRFVEESLQNR